MDFTFAFIIDIKLIGIVLFQIKMALIWYVLAVALATAQAQSNYGSQANNVEYQGDGLPEQTVLDGKVRFSHI